MQTERTMLLPWNENDAADLYEAFRKVLVNDCLIRGGLASESAVTPIG